MLFRSNGVFSLYEYRFEDPQDYNSLVLVKHKRYSLEETVLSLEMIQEALNSVSTVIEPEVPFPQADSFERVINLCELLNEHTELSQEYITTEYDFNKRQTDYYTNAGRYLGLVAKKNDEGVKYYLTDAGKALFKVQYTQRQLMFVKSILKHSDRKSVV